VTLESGGANEFGINYRRTALSTRVGTVGTEDRHYSGRRVAGMSGAANGAGAGPAAPSRDRSRLAPITRQASFFTGIGLVASVANAALYLLLRQWWNAEIATVVAVTATTLMSTEANRRMTFAEARTSRAGLVVQNLAVILFYCTYNTAALWMLHQIATEPSARAESLALLIASTAGGTARFVLLRAWVFRGRGAAATQTTGTQMTVGPVAARPATAQPATPVDDLIGGEQDDDQRRPRIETLVRRCRPHHSAHH